MSYLGLVRANLGRNKLRTVLTGGAIMLAVVLVCLLLTIARPSSAIAASPEIYGSEMDYTARVLVVRGVGLIGGTPGSPNLPVVNVWGRVVGIDGAASVGATNFTTGEGSLIIPFNAIVSALPQAVKSTPNGNQIPGDTNFAVVIKQCLHSPIILIQ